MGVDAGAGSKAKVASIEKMTVGHENIAKARLPDHDFVWEGLACAEAVLRQLDQDRETLARYGFKLHDSFVQMYDSQLKAVKALQMLIENVRTLLGVDALLTPEERVAKALEVGAD